MTDIAGQARPLPYPIDRAVSLQAETDDSVACGIPEFPEDVNEKIPVVFMLSISDFVALASAVDAGSDLAYGDKAVLVWKIWTDSVMCATICELVADCIETSEEVEAALAARIQSSTLIQEALNSVYNQFVQGGVMPPAVSGKNLTGANEGCNLDKLWGFIDGGIEGMNANNLDAQQSVEAITNIVERAATVVAAIPGVGVLPVDEVVDYVQGLWSDDLFENYEAGDTTGYRDELKCDIFCLARANDCRVSVDLLIDYFKGRLSYSGADVVNDIVQFLIDGTWTGTLVNDTFYLAQCLWMKNGNRYFPIQGLMSFSTLFALGEPSDDWELLCEECPECGIGYTVDIGTVDGDNIVSAATSLVERLDIPPATAYGRRIQVTFDAPVSSVELGWNTEGALDDMFAAGAGLTAETLAAPSGSTTLLFPEAITTLFVDLGYAGDSGAYASNPARITIVDACE